MTAKRFLVVLVLVLPILGIIAYSLWPAALHPSSDGSRRKVLFYQDSMHPWVKSDQPGKCTICAMDLTPIYEGEKGFGTASNVVVFSSNNITVLNVQTEEVKSQPLRHSMQVAGTLEANETRKTIVSAPAPGRIESLAVEYAGVEVQEGQTLFTFYSPELTTLKRRYVLLNRVTGPKSPAASLMLESATENPGSMKGHAGELPLAQRDPVKAWSEADPYYTDLVAPLSGTVLERNIYNGQYVAEGEKLLTIADASVLWFRFDVYPRQLPWLAVGQILEVVVEGVPGKVFPAVISFIEPVLNDATRSLKVRADIQNPLVTANGRKHRLLQFGLYAEGRLRAETENVLAVSRSAILFPGASAYAYVDKGNGAYEQRRVKLGHQSDTLWEILAGLEEGDRVVTSGNVLMDAQAQFNQIGQPELALVHEPARAEPGHAPTLAHKAAMPSISPPVSAVISKPVATNRAPGSKPVKAATEGYRGGRDNIGDDLMVRAIATRLAARTNAAGAKPSAVEPLAGNRQQAIQAFIPVADGISRALAADDLAQFNQQVAKLAAVLPPLQKELAAPHRWAGVVQRMAIMAQGGAAKDLEAARSRFLPFSTAVVELAKQLRKEVPALAGLKIYHCPMAPKPGLWLQLKGPLRNPFYGAKMLTCGEEVGLTSPDADSSPTPGNKSPAPPK